MVTETQAREMMDAVTAFQLKDANEAKIEGAKTLAIAQQWFDSLPGINKNPISKRDALDNYRTIESLIHSVSEKSKTTVLRRALLIANDTFKTIKRTTHIHDLKLKNLKAV